MLSHLFRRHHRSRRHAARVVSGLVMLPLAAGACSRESSPCAEAYGRRAWKEAVSACDAAFAKGRAPADGALLAQSLIQLADNERAAAVGRQLLGGQEAAVGHRVLGLHAYRRKQMAAASVYLTTSVALAAIAGRDGDVARAAHAFGGVLFDCLTFDAASTMIELTRARAARSGERRLQGYAELARADLLRVVGDDLGAQQSMDQAVERLSPFCDAVWVTLKQGLLHSAQRHTNLAAQTLRRAITAGRLCQARKVVEAAHIHLAWLAWYRGDAAAAEQYLAGAPPIGETSIVRALLAVERHEFDEAMTWLELAGADSHNLWAWLTPYLQGEVAELRGDVVAAEEAYRRAVATIATQRRGGRGYAAYLVASHRLPHEALFELYARAGRWRDALSIVVELDASDMLRVTSAPGRLGPDGLVALPGGALPLQPMPMLGDAFARSDVAAVLDAWRDRDLVIVVTPSARPIRGGPERAWRLHVRRGEIRGEDIGAASEVAAAADRLLGDPADAGAATSLGAAIVPHDDEPGPLFILPVGAVARAPLAAMRTGSALALSSRPLVRVLGLRPRAPHARSREAAFTAMVLGDPRRDLRAADDEARWVGNYLGVKAFVGKAATVARLLGSPQVSLLHIAAHTDERASRRTLHLSDGDIGVAEILEAKLAPQLVVLASCGSAAARDEGGWGSLAAAFLAAGSQAVVGTHWSVGDEITAAMVRLFYQAGGADNPAAAMAKAQVAMAAISKPSQWAAFTVVAAPPELREPEGSPMTARRR